MKMPEVGELFEGKYRIDGVIGEGGFGRVLRATTESTGRQVAIKLLKSKDGGYQTSHERRFLREMRAIAQLQCPYTLTLYDFGQTDGGLLYMVCEYIAGVDLLDLIVRRQTLEEPVVIRLLYQALQSLAEAHKLGILHRDIKPSNIRTFESADGHLDLKVLDFGLAKSLDSTEARLTGTGKVVGTPRYMPPEHLVGADLAPSSDIFALGIVATEMLVGRERTAVGAGRVRRLMLTPDDPVSPGLRAIVNKMVDPDMDERWQSAAELLTALRAFRRGEWKPAPERRDTAEPTALEPTVQQDRRGSGSGSRSSPTRTQPPEPTERNPLWMIGAAALAIVAVILVASYFNSPGPAPAPVVTKRTENPLAAVREPEVIEDVSADTTPADVAATCGQPQVPGVMKIWPDAEISWAVHIPKNYDPDTAYPLVLFYPAETAASPHQYRVTGLADLADEKSFIAVVPVLGAHLMQTWREKFSRLNRLMLKDLSKEVCIDWRRVYAYADGEGGGRTTGLSCTPWITAVVAHDFHPKPPRYCRARVPLLNSTPIDSEILPAAGGASCIQPIQAPSAANVVKWWRKELGCSKRRTTHFEHKDGVCYRYEGCSQPFIRCETAGGYGWPAEPNSFTRGFCGSEPKASLFPELEVAWRFFESHKLPGAQCTEAAEFAGERRELKVGKHSALLIVPEGYTGARPLSLMVAFHSDGQDPRSLLRQTELEKYAREHNVALLLPRGRLMLSWQKKNPVDGVEELVEKVKHDLCIDEVWLFGHGSGGHATTALACEAWVDAIATTSYRPAADAKLCDEPVRVIRFHATQSKRMPLEGKGEAPCTPRDLMSLDEFETHDARRNDCAGGSVSWFESETGACTTWTCEVPTVTCRLQGGHGFPGGTEQGPLDQLCDEPPADFPAMQKIMEFLTD